MKNLNSPGVASNKSIRSLILILIGISRANFLKAEPIQFQSGETQTALLELYTSEGCSSCPPAETWLSRHQAAPQLWKDFVPVAFHVDYWNRLGWRDPWSSSQFSERQRNWAHHQGSESIYTPEFVLNGREWTGWAGRKEMPRSDRKTGRLTIISTNGRDWQVSFLPVTTDGHYEVQAALLAGKLSSDVSAGENSGRYLTHEFVALKLVTRPLTKRGEAFQGEFIFDPKSATKTARLSVAAWITRTGQSEPLQATGGWLPP